LRSKTVRANSNPEYPNTQINNDFSAKLKISGGS